MIKTIALIALFCNRTYLVEYDQKECMKEMISCIKYYGEELKKEETFKRCITDY